MRPGTIARSVRHHYLRHDWRRNYWRLSALLAELRRAMASAPKGFRAEALRRQWQFVTASLKPVVGETRERAALGVAWLLRAQQATADAGVSLGYFPCAGGESAWKPSYPETTGYIITTLLAYAARTGRQEVAAQALSMADWEVEVQMASGAVQGGAVCAPSQQTAAAFNTGMVLDGWCSAYAHSRQERYLEAARRAADFLVNDLDAQGHFQTNGSFVSAGEVKTYTCLCAWAMHRFGDLVGEPRYGVAAVQAVEAALRQQSANGWFAHNCLNNSRAPLTHTIGYTMQGVLEVGVLSGRQDFVDAVRLTAAHIIPRVRDDGFLPGRFFPDWEPAVFSSCLTGSAQIAIVLYRLASLTGDVGYRRVADRLVNALKSLQATDSSDLNINGAIAGSYPLYGGYMRAGYPNWATKYFVDALMLQEAGLQAKEVTGSVLGGGS